MSSDYHRDQAHAALNQKYFDELAAKYDSQPWQIDLTRKITTFMRENADTVLPNSSGKNVRLLDYACGTGMVTKALADRITEAIGIDISTKMVEQYNILLSSSSITNATGEPLQATAISGDLFADEIPKELQDPSLYNFDIAAIGLGFHHFSSFSTALLRLKERLSSGGSLLIIDFADDSESLPSDTVKVHGFSDQSMAELFKEAGLENPVYIKMEGHVELRPGGKEPVKKQVFLGRAIKP